eukprot:7758907-Pyramimonas_sp.AAC.1
MASATRVAEEVRARLRALDRLIKRERRHLDTLHIDRLLEEAELHRRSNDTSNLWKVVYQIGA